MNTPTRITRRIVRYPDGRIEATEQIDFAHDEYCLPASYGEPRYQFAPGYVDDGGVTFAPSVSWWGRLVFNLFAD